MHFVSAVVIPSLVIFMMTIVGLELTAGDFRRIADFPFLVVVTLAAQLVVVPLVAALIIKVVHADASLAAGLILVAASPVAAISSYYAMLARANIALAVTLTALSSALALIATPVVAAVAFDLLLAKASAIHMPLGRAIQQLLIGLVLPIAVGMWIRVLAPHWVARHRRTLTRLSLLALAVLVIYVLVDQAAIVAADLLRWVAAALLFTIGGLVSGYAVGATMQCARSERIAVAIGFSARNLGVAIMIAVTVLNRVDFVAFGAVFFASQLLLVVPLLVWSRVRGGAERAFESASYAQRPDGAS